jgi:hypothetical protein
MTPFVVVDAGGEIIRHGLSPDPSVHASAGHVIEEYGTPETHHVVGGAIVAYTDEQRTAKAARPLFAATWSNTAFEWVDERPVEQARLDAMAAMKSARDSAIFGGFEWDGSAFDSDQVSQTRMTGLFLSSRDAGFTTENWRLADNSWRALDAADAAGLWAALQAHIKNAVMQFATKEAAIGAAASVDAVKAISWAD